VPDATFACPDLTTFCRLDELGLEVTGQRIDPDRAVLACRVVEPDQWCRRCGCEGTPRDTVVRRLAHEPLGWRPTTLEVVVRRYRCTGCRHVWRQDTTRAAEPRAKLSRRGLRWALEGIVCQHLTVARVAEGLGVAWSTANDAVLAEGKRVLIEDPGRFRVGERGRRLPRCSSRSTPPRTPTPPRPRCSSSPTPRSGGSTRRRSRSGSGPGSGSPRSWRSRPRSAG
jgi:hypothetical protein